MPVFPYKVRPTPPLLAVLQADGEHVEAEELGTVPLATLPADYRVWGSWDDVNVLWGDGKGEALCWQSRPVRWRAERVFEVNWTTRHTDVRVLRLGFPETPEQTLAGMIEWRNWLGVYGAAPGGSLGSTAFSLLRARLQRTLWMSIGWAQCGPPLRFVMGGRQELVEQGRFEPAQHYDLPAAYSSELGTMRYGGHWTEVGLGYPTTSVARQGVLCFIRARVRIPDLPFGPLPRRPRRAPRKTDAMVSFGYRRYPVGQVMQGVWTWEELEAAAEVGCKIQRLQVWIHHCGKGQLPFLPWWQAVQKGRSMEGFAGQLAKATGNALWGQFCITPGAERTVAHWSGTRRNPDRHKRPAPMVGASPHYAPDLAETLTGRIRAELYRCMHRTGRPSLLCAHTDGIWAGGAVPVLPQWRAKQTVARLDLLTPQFMRYYRSPPPLGTAEYVVAGAPDTLASAIFDLAWDGMARDGRVPA